MSKSIKALVSKNLSKFIILQLEKEEQDLLILTPYNKMDNGFLSNFIVPNNRLDRCHAIEKMIPELCSLTESENDINVDLLNNVNHLIDLDRTDDNGLFLLKCTKTETSFEVEKINHLIEFTLKEHTFKTKSISFKTDRIKIFPLIFNNGFILSIVDNFNNVTTYITLRSLKNELYIPCGKSEINHINSYLTPLWNDEFKKNKSGVFTLREDLTSLLYEPEFNVTSVFKLKRNCKSNNASIRKVYDQMEIM